MKRIDCKGLYLFLLFLVATGFPLCAQELYPISLFPARLPLTDQMREVQEQDSTCAFYNRKRSVIYDFPYGKDSITGVLEDTSKWRFITLQCFSHQGYMDQSEVNGSRLFLIGRDTSNTLTGAELYTFFSADTAFSINRAIHTNFNSDDQHPGEWYIAQWENYLLLKLALGFSIASQGDNAFGAFYHSEEYWYFFGKVVE
jgi:hypothetical protein